jgi:hypothetical protein
MSGRQITNNRTVCSTKNAAVKPLASCSRMDVLVKDLARDFLSQITIRIPNNGLGRAERSRSKVTFSVNGVQ